MTAIAFLNQLLLSPQSSGSTHPCIALLRSIDLYSHSHCVMWKGMHRKLALFLLPHGVAQYVALTWVLFLVAVAKCPDKNSLWEKGLFGLQVKGAEPSMAGRKHRGYTVSIDKKQREERGVTVPDVSPHPSPRQLLTFWVSWHISVSISLPSTDLKENKYRYGPVHSKAVNH